jgi:cellulose synthase/poly-beta-1,6-N-acetylglucosamine synthase-like glycosyltransferase
LTTMTADLTIVIPIWDHHVQFLPRCLQAIHDEAIPVELVVIDNASTVQLRERPTDAQHITLAKRHSIGGARNAGLAHVNTPFVLFADADDQIAPGSLVRSLALLRRHPGAAGVLGRSLVEEHGHYRRGIRPSVSFRLACRITPWLASLFWLTGYQCSITSTLLRTDTVRRAGGFADDNIAEDWQLAARMSRRGHFICLDEPVRIYHRHNHAARNTAPHPPPNALRRTICDDCLTDPRATPAQRLVASALRSQTGRRQNA